MPMNHHGHYPGAPNGGYQPHGPMSQSPQPYAATSMNMPQGGGSYPHSQQPNPTSTVFTCRDVLNGRGQGVQRHPGNVKYRTLVFVNKGLYAKCPRADKMKISKGIVAAVREMGGGFLELEERTGTYKDIGDKKATEKTSQALREGQTKIRKQMYKDEEKGGNQTYDTSLLGSAANGPVPGREISAQGYFGYSVQVLESLYNAEENNPDAPHPTSAVQPATPQLTIANAVTSSNVAVPSSNAPAALSPEMARALEQFDGMIPVPPPAAPPQAQTQMPPPCPPLPPAAAPAADGRQTNSSVRFTESGRPSLSGRNSLGRLTNMSLMSMFSINSVRQLVEVANQVTEDNFPLGDNARGSIQSILSAEIRDLIRLSEPQLLQVDNMTMDSPDASDDNMHVDEEVVLHDQKDRVSELRFTDVGRDTWGRDTLDGRDTIGGRGTISDVKVEGDDSRYTCSSLMDSSMMTIPTDEMSLHTSADRKYKPGDLASAELLLRLSDNNKNGKSHQV